MSKAKLFIRKNKVNINGRTPIYIRYSHNDKTVDFSTGEQIDPSYWDASNQRVKKSYLGHNGMNNYIQQKLLEIETIKLKLKGSGVDPSVQSVKTEYSRLNATTITTEPVVKKALEYWNDFMNHRSQVLRCEASTIKQLNASKRVFEEFENYLGHKMDFQGIDNNLLDRFKEFAYNEKKYSHNSLGCKIKHLKSFLNWCVKFELTSIVKFREFRKPSNETSIFALTQEQLDKLYYLDLTDNPRLERTRDLFVFGCATGLRFSDYSKVANQNIKDGMIIMNMEKTEREVRIPINDYSRTIIEKYPDGLPVLSNVNLNKYIKEVGIRAEFFEDCEIISFTGGKKKKGTKKLYQILSTHCARRTYATQSLQRGMHMSLVMKVTGHKDLRSFMKYVHVADPKLKEEVSKAWNTLKK